MIQPVLKTEVEYLDRDVKSRALLNNNINEYLLFKSKRARDKMIDDVIKDVEFLKEDISDIKNMLRSVLKGCPDG